MNYNIVFRKLLRDKLYLVISFLSLIILMVVGAYIITFSVNELSYDRFHDNHDRIYRITTVWESEKVSDQMAITNGNTAIHLQDSYSFIESATRILRVNENPTVIYKENQFQTKDFYRADPSILHVFTFHFISGNKDNALDNPNDVIISESWARRIFGHIDCIDEVLETKDGALKVTGVFEDLPQNTDLHISGVINGNFGSEISSQFAFNTYVLLGSGATKFELDGALQESSKQVFSNNLENIVLSAQHLPELHFITDIKMDNPKGNLLLIQITLFAGLLLYLIINSNLANLNFVKILEQLKKISVHKVLGASKWHLLKVYLVELAVVWFGSFLLSIFIISATMTQFSSFTDIHITTDYMILIGLFCLFILLSFLVSCGYLMFSSLKTKASLGMRKLVAVNLPGSSIRKYLVGFQMVLSSVMLAVVLLLIAQHNYSLTKDLGFKSDSIFQLKLNEESTNRIVLNNKIAQIVGNDNFTVFWKAPMQDDDLPFSTLQFMGNDLEKQSLVVSDFTVAPNYIDLMEIKLLSGDSKDNLNEPYAYVNQSLKNYLELDTDQLTFELPWGTKGKVKGVVADFHYQSLHNKIQPLIMIIDPEIENIWNGMLINASASQFVEISELISSEFSNDVLESGWLNDDLVGAYEKEIIAIRLTGIFLIIGVLITILGLFVFLVYILKSKTFEISVRKMLGAGFRDFLMFFGKEFGLIVVGSIVFSSWIIFQMKISILERYAYAIDLSELWILLPIVIVMVVIFSIFVMIANRANRINLALSLRND